MLRQRVSRKGRWCVLQLLLMDVNPSGRWGPAPLQPSARSGVQWRSPWCSGDSIEHQSVASPGHVAFLLVSSHLKINALRSFLLAECCLLDGAFLIIVITAKHLYIIQKCSIFKKGQRVVMYSTERKEIKEGSSQQRHSCSTGGGITRNSVMPASPQSGREHVRHLPC